MRKWIALAALLAALVTPTFAQTSVVNAATFQGRFPVAPGSLASAFGTFTGVTQTAAQAVPLPTTLGGVQVLINNVASPLVFVSAGQINFQVPFATAAGRTNVSVTLNGAEVSKGTIDVLPTSPGIFVLDFQNPTLPGAVLNQDSSVNSQQAPAKRGDVIQIFATGQGANLSAQVANGAKPTALTTTVEVPEVYVSVAKANVTFSGLSPDFPGLWQINITIPNQTFVTGQVPLAVYLGGLQSNIVSIWVAP